MSESGSTVGAFLGIETSGTATAVALVTGDRELVETARAGTAHNEVLFGLIARVIAAGNIAPVRLAGIGVTIGPGMFTSLRVGLSAAKALALAHSIPLAGIDTFTALAADVAVNSHILAVVDARKQQVYAALHLGLTRLLGPLLATPAELTARVAEATGTAGRILVAGSGSALCLPLLEAAGLAATDSGILTPSAAGVGRLARARVAAGLADDVGRLEPLYLRRTDAELVREQRWPG